MEDEPIPYALVPDEINMAPSMLLGVSQARKMIRIFLSAGTGDAMAQMRAMSDLANFLNGLSQRDWQSLHMWAIEEADA